MHSDCSSWQDVVLKVTIKLLCVDQVARLQDAKTLLYEPRDAHEAESLLEQLNRIRKEANIPPLQPKHLGLSCHSPLYLPGASCSM